MENNEFKVKDVIYYARILPNVGIFEVCELRIRSIYSDWFSAVEKCTKRAYCFSNLEIGKIVFKDRYTALDMVLEAEAHSKAKTFSEKDVDIYS